MARQLDFQVGWRAASGWSCAMRVHLFLFDEITAILGFESLPDSGVELGVIFQQAVNGFLNHLRSIPVASS